MRMTTSAALLAATLTLSACGGGGSDAGDTTVYNANVAFDTLLSTTLTRQLTGSYQGQNLSLQLQFRPGTGSQFPFTGAPAREQRNIATITGPGGSSTVTASYYVGSNGLVLGSVDDPDGTPSCAVATSSAAVPAAVTLGQGGPIASGKVYASCSAGAAVVGSFTETWAVRSRDGISYFCDESTSTVSGATSSGRQCFAINADGSIAPQAWFEVNLGGGATVSFFTP